MNGNLNSIAIKRISWAEVSWKGIQLKIQLIYKRIKFKLKQELDQHFDYAT